jgi:hypothetical protein
MKISSSIADLQNIYGSEKTSQTSSKPFVIPGWGTEVENKMNSTPTANTLNTSKSEAFAAIAAGNFDFKSPNPFQAAKDGNFTLPPWIPTKTEPTRSDAEILKEMEELAKEHAKTGQLPHEDPRYLALMDEYISSVSPDRAGIVERSINEINERIATESYSGELEEAEKKEKNKDLIEYFLEELDKKRLAKLGTISSMIATRGNSIGDMQSMYDIMSIQRDGDYASVEIDCGDGKTTSLTYYKGELQPYMEMKGNTYNAFIDGGKVSHAQFTDENGEMIMSWDKDRGFGAIPLGTGAEYARRHELMAMYNAAYDFARGEYNPPENSVGSSDIGSSYESTLRSRKEMYIDAYNKLKSEAA